MNVVRDITGYGTSKDYKALFKIVRSQSIICLVDFDSHAGSVGGGHCSRDVARSIYTDDGLIQISARGTCYVWAKDVDDFVQQCEKQQLEWVVPMPRELTAENGAKAALIGEIFEYVRYECPNCSGGILDCFVCDGEGGITDKITVSWTNIKAIYKEAVRHFAR
jgi:hypothetical protein